MPETTITPRAWPNPAARTSNLPGGLSMLALIDVRGIDHIVVGTEGSVSFAERGLI